MTKPDIVDRLKRRIVPLVGRAGWGSVETDHGLIGDAIALLGACVCVAIVWWVLG